MKKIGLNEYKSTWIYENQVGAEIHTDPCLLFFFGWGGGGGRGIMAINCLIKEL